MQKPTLLVLAAGMGSRYGGLKQMDPMGPSGEAVLDYSVYDAIRAGFGKVVFVIREDFAEEFKQQVGARFAERIQIEYVFQDLHDIPAGFSVPDARSKPWGTAHAVYAARKVIQEPFAVINADDFYGADAYKVIFDWFCSSNFGEGEKSHYAMVGYPLRNTLSDHGTVNRGICGVDENHYLSDVEEVINIARQEDGSVSGEGIDGAIQEIPEDKFASMNFWGFGPGFFAQIEQHFSEFLRTRAEEEKSECFIPTVVDDYIRQGLADCIVLPTSATWFGVTYADDKPRVVQSIAELVAAGEYPEKLSE